MLGRRIAAYFVDSGIILLYVLLLFAVSVALDLPSPAAALFADPFLAQAIGAVTLTLPAALFLALFESSRRMATPGKLLLGIQVTRGDGARLGFGRAFARSAVKLLPWELAHFFVWRIPRDPGAVQGLPPWIAVGLGTVFLLLLAYLVLPLLNPRGRSIHDLAACTFVRPHPPY